MRISHLARCLPLKLHAAQSFFVFSSQSLSGSALSSLSTRALLQRPRLLSTIAGGMADRSKVPYAPQDVQEISQAIAALEKHTRKGKGGFSCRKKTYEVSEKSDKTVDSWSLSDWDYKKPHLPTYARGLFTHTNNGKPEIAVRGYDKFFNVDEVVKTRWRNVEQHTRGPYELSVKENGCIIFIAGLDDETLLITSKHSTGPRQDASANHAAAGEKWVTRQLSSLGRTKGDLAKRLRRMNATAVAELCDDEFEEHVLRYDPSTAGLYLHGINLNLPEFATYPGNLVAKFAEEWGFKKTMYVIEEDINQVKKFLDKVAETGNYAGRDTEGFVIRCQVQDGPGAPWHDWFFKYKFEEPYLMYRQWREVTKAIIGGKVPRFKKHQKITQEYILYARRQLAKDPQIGKLFNQNHGIIAMRDGFLKEKGMKGSEIIRNEMEDEGALQASDVTKNVVLVPVATIGCGKTTVALALTKLFDWGHEQNDNVVGKGKRPQIFAGKCTNSMALHNVLIADRNNHQRRERDQIISDIRKVVPEAKFVALHYVHDRGNYNEIRKAMQERVLARGDNHQTIHAGSKGGAEIIGIMNGFMNRFEPVDVERSPDDEFDLVIDLDVTASSRENLGMVVHQLHEGFPKLFRMPSDEDMDAAIQYALNDYSPDIKQDLSKKSQGPKGGRDANKPTSNGTAQQPKSPKFEYFCVALPAERVSGILDAVFVAEPPETARFYNQLKAGRRVQPAFHVTLLHRAQSAQYAKYWDRLGRAWQQKKGDGDAVAAPGAMSGVNIAGARVRLQRVVWDERIMAVEAQLLDAGGSGDGFGTTNEFAHVTVGTAQDSIKPRESNDMLARWHRGEGRGRIRDVTVKGDVVLEGSVRAVMSR